MDNTEPNLPAREAEPPAPGAAPPAPDGWAERLAAAEAEAREAREALRAQADRFERERRRLETAAAASEALRRGGALPDAVPLLCREVDPERTRVRRGVLEDEEAVLASLRRRFPTLFRRREPLPQEPLAPPRAGRGLTAEGIRGMTPDDINRNWSAVSAALRKGD